MKNSGLTYLATGGEVEPSTSGVPTAESKTPKNPFSPLTSYLGGLPEAESEAALSRFDKERAFLQKQVESLQGGEEKYYEGLLQNLAINAPPRSTSEASLYSDVAKRNRETLGESRKRLSDLESLKHGVSASREAQRLMSSTKPDGTTKTLEEQTRDRQAALSRYPAYVENMLRARKEGLFKSKLDENVTDFWDPSGGSQGTPRQTAQLTPSQAIQLAELAQKEVKQVWETGRSTEMVQQLLQKYMAQGLPPDVARTLYTNVTGQPATPAPGQPQPATPAPGQPQPAAPAPGQPQPAAPAPAATPPAARPAAPRIGDPNVLSEKQRQEVTGEIIKGDVKKAEEVTVELRGKSTAAEGHLTNATQIEKILDTSDGQAAQKFLSDPTVGNILLSVMRSGIGGKAGDIEARVAADLTEAMQLWKLTPSQRSAALLLAKQYVGMALSATKEAGSTAQISNYERQLFAQLAPSIFDPITAVKLRTEAIKVKATYDRDVAKAWNAYRDNNRLGTWENFTGTEAYQNLLKAREAGYGTIYKKYETQLNANLNTSGMKAQNDLERIRAEQERRRKGAQK